MRRLRSLDHLCSYVGLVPNIYSSGDTTHIGNLTARKKHLSATYFDSMLLESSK
jgi:transposase